MKELFANNISTTIAAGGLSDVGLVLNVSDATGMPSPGEGEFFRVTLFRIVNGLEQGHEVVTCTSRTGNQLTLDARSVEGAAASQFSEGDRVEMRTTAGMLKGIQDVAGPILPIVNLGSVGLSGAETVDIDLSLGSFFFMDMYSATGTITLNILNEPDIQDSISSFHIEFRAGGRRTVEWPAGYDAAGGVTPGMGASASNYDTWLFYIEKHLTTRRRFMLIESK